VGPDPIDAGDADASPVPPDGADIADPVDTDEPLPDVPVVPDTDTGAVEDPDRTVRAVDPILPLANPWVVFVSRRTGLDRLFLVRADGTDLTLVDVPDALPAAPSFSADGRRLLYVTTQPGTGQVVRLVDITTGATETLRPGLRNLASPVMSADGRWVAVSGRPAEGDAQEGIWVMRADGSGAAFELSAATQPNTGPSWTRDGQLWFASGGENKVYYRLPSLEDGTEPIEEGRFAQLQGRVALGPFGDEWAAQTGVDTAAVLTLTRGRSSGSSTSVTVGGTFNDGSPTLAADGRLMAWAGGVDGSETELDVYLLRFFLDEGDTNRLRRLAPRTGRDGAPAIAPVESEGITPFWPPFTED
jgi:hypothetical protein